MEINWGNLIHLLYAVCALIGGSIVGTIIGLPFGLLIDLLDRDYPSEPIDWEITILVSWFIGAMILILVVFVVLSPAK